MQATDLIAEVHGIAPFVAEQVELGMAGSDLRDAQHVYSIGLLAPAGREHPRRNVTATVLGMHVSKNAVRIRSSVDSMLISCTISFYLSA